MWAERESLLSASTSNPGAGAGAGAAHCMDLSHGHRFHGVQAALRYPISRLPTPAEQSLPGPPPLEGAARRPGPAPPPRDTRHPWNLRTRSTSQRPQDPKAAPEWIEQDSVTGTCRGRELADTPGEQMLHRAATAMLPVATLQTGPLKSARRHQAQQMAFSSRLSPRDGDGPV